MAIQKEIWQQAIIENLFPDNSFSSKATNDDMYVNNKTVHIPNAGAPSGVVMDRTSKPATVSERTDNDLTYDLHEATTNPILIANADTVQLSYDKRMSVIRNDQLNLQKTVAQNLLYYWVPSDTKFLISTTGDSVAAHTASATGNRLAVSLADISNLQAKMNADDIPTNDRYILLDSIMYQQLIDSLTTQQYLAFQQLADIKNGILGNLYGFNIMQRSQALRYTSAKVLSKWDAAGAATDLGAGLAWQMDSVSRALGEVKMFSKMDDPSYYGDVYSFLVRFGGRNRRYDGKGVYALLQGVPA